MTSTLLISLSSTLFEDNSFLTLSSLLDCGVHLRVLNLWSSNCRIVRCSDHQHIIDADLLTNIERNLLNGHEIISSDFHLRPVYSNHGKDLIWMSRNRHTLL